MLWRAKAGRTASRGHRCPDASGRPPSPVLKAMSRIPQLSALFVVNTDGTGLRRLTPWGFAQDTGSWSPDGRWILFANPEGNLYVVHPDGRGLRQVTVDTGPSRSFAFQPGWSPDGRRIVFSMALESAGYQEDIFTVRADGTGLKGVTNRGSLPHPWARLRLSGLRTPCSHDSAGAERVPAPWRRLRRAWPSD
jgi:Tol biopolymer transport system component